MKTRPAALAPNLKLAISLSIFLILVTLIKVNAAGKPDPDDPPIVGRWDITVNQNGKMLPSWLEVYHSGNHHLIGQFVGAGGSARPISKVNFTDGKMNFTIPPQWEADNNDLVFNATLQGDSLTGTMLAANGHTYNWVGHRAPLLQRDKAPKWGKPITLFNGKNTDGWHTTGANQWVAENGILKSPHSGSNIITDKTFMDFKLHIEFRYPAESNSGVYLRGRYEVQVEDSKGKYPQKDLLGAIYGFIAPNEMVAKAPGEWQSYDITLTGRLVTVVANGKTIICNQEIPGITGGALNSNEAEAGPIYLQGDHGPVEYRNIVITPAE